MPTHGTAGVAGPDPVLMSGAVCGRWYGGIQLGPDRFKHINNVARSLLAARGYVASAGDAVGEAQAGRRRR